jgi:phage terminase large subunit-like protein
MDSLNKPVEEMSEAERAATLATLNQLEADLVKQADELKSVDPFYYYEPSTGDLTPDATKFLGEYLKPEDIPQKCDSQLDAHLSTAETIANFGGNQGGKTTWLVIEALIHATGEVPNSLRHLYPTIKKPEEKMRYLRLEGESDQQLDDVLIPAMRYWVPRDYLAGRSWDASFSAKSKTLTLGKNGRDCAKIQFNSFTQEVTKLQGKKLTFVGYDEEPPRKHREENLFRFTTAKRLCERFSMTPTNGISWVKEEILDKQGPTVRAFKMASVTNKYANLAILRQIVDKLTSYEAKKMRLLGEFVSLSGLIYGGIFHRDIHIIPPFAVGCNCKEFAERGEHHHKCAHRQYMVVRGADIHTVTPPAMVEVAIDPQENLYVVGVYNPRTCPDIEQIKADWAERVAERKYRVRWSIVDKSLDYDIKAAAGLNLYKKMIRGANKVRPLYKSEKFSGSIMTGVDELKQLMKVNPETKKPRLFFFDTPEVYPLINDIETLERDTYQDEDRKGQKDQILEGKKHRHAALRYITQRKLNWKPLDEPQYLPPDEDDSYI